MKDRSEAPSDLNSTQDEWRLFFTGALAKRQLSSPWPGCIRIEDAREAGH